MSHQKPKKITPNLSKIKTQPANFQQNQPIPSHCTNLNSSLLPKIHRKSTTQKKKTSHSHLNYASQSQQLTHQTSDLQRKQRMSIIIHDYLQNFRTKQKGVILAVANQNCTQKFQKKSASIKVQGISHEKFIGKQGGGCERTMKVVSLDVRNKVRMKSNYSFLQKLKHDSRLNSLKQRNKFFIQQQKQKQKKSSNTNSISDLKDYILKAKKSAIDIRQNHHQKPRKIKKVSQIGVF